MVTIHPGLVLILALACMSLLVRGDDDPVLKITPANMAVNPGQDITFQCVHYPADTAADIKLQWYIAGHDTPIPYSVQNDTTNATDSRYSASNGTLTIKQVTLNDTQSFVCKSLDGKLSKETTLRVFVMPSYFMEGMIVVGINMGLIVIFILCSIWSFVRNRRERRENQESRRKHKLGHREVAKRMMSE